MTTKKQIKRHLCKRGRFWTLFVDCYTAGKLIDKKTVIIDGKRKDALRYAWLLLNFLEPSATVTTKYTINQRGRVCDK